jgi:hypothetical protein
MLSWEAFDIWGPVNSALAAVHQLSGLFSAVPQDGAAATIIGNSSLVAALSAIASAAWKAVAWAFDWVRFRCFAVRRFSIPVTLDVKERDLRAKASIYCLIIRHGSDEYLKHMASPAERMDGRQLLWIRKVRVQQDRDGNAVLDLRLKVHRALGTQFKCFAQPRRPGLVNEVQELLRKATAVSDVRRSDSAYKDRVYFFLEALKPAEPDPNARISNNYLFPA